MGEQKVRLSIPNPHQPLHLLWAMMRRSPSATSGLFCRSSSNPFSDVARQSKMMEDGNGEKTFGSSLFFCARCGSGARLNYHHFHALVVDVINRSDAIPTVRSPTQFTALSSTISTPVAYLPSRTSCSRTEGLQTHVSCTWILQVTSESDRPPSVKFGSRSHAAKWTATIPCKAKEKSKGRGEGTPSHRDRCDVVFGTFVTGNDEVLNSNAAVILGRLEERRA
ncbi:hypothetical protein H6P81_006149 [Aristolochia fimbriata]|uniref:Uncharacterized protein n=1 Tax=Aristolochia fimbriata TaxID=158543 RepID=A0AAV7EWI3_ARIFI|nr:hypothetical protein H6P81_006149 [Aristolochia fimbriata]